jgi:hypothetical protein
MRNKEELPQQWKESIVVPSHKKGDKTDYNNYLPLINCLQNPSFFWPDLFHVNEIVGVHQCAFCRAFGRY